MGRGRARKSIELVEASAAILREIQPATVRAVCYRLFVVGLIDSMSKANTNRVSTQLVWARENGVIPWEHIVDETRRPERVPSWRSPQAIFDTCVRSYRRDYWSEQPYRVEVWSEKGTVRGTLAPILDEHGVTFRVMRGYGSATGLYDVAMESRNSDKPFVALYVGDRDPSGMHMSEVDLPGRIDQYGGQVQIIRIAIVDEDTTSKANVPSFNASEKVGDPRHRWYVERYGNKCWELDALTPVILRQRVEDSIDNLLDIDAWNRAIEIEAAERESLERYVAAYPGISMPATKYP